MASLPMHVNLLVPRFQGWVLLGAAVCKTKLQPTNCNHGLLKPAGPKTPPKHTKHKPKPPQNRPQTTPKPFVGWFGGDFGGFWRCFGVFWDPVGFNTTARKLQEVMLKRACTPIAGER